MTSFPIFDFPDLAKSSLADDVKDKKLIFAWFLSMSIIQLRLYPII